MKVFGRRLLDGTRAPVPLDGIDDVVFEDDQGQEIVLSLYRARIDGRIEVRTNEGFIAVLPRAANVIEVTPHGPTRRKRRAKAAEKEDLQPRLAGTEARASQADREDHGI